jgi:Tat protein secretion system quality control protein TatD with DNase activity
LAEINAEPIPVVADPSAEPSVIDIPTPVITVETAIPVPVPGPQKSGNHEAAIQDLKTFIGTILNSKLEEIKATVVETAQKNAMKAIGL